MTSHLTCVQVQQKDLSDEAIARAVCVKVGDSPGVSYSDIAAKAYECGRTELAIKVDFLENGRTCGSPQSPNSVKCEQIY